MSATEGPRPEGPRPEGPSAPRGWRARIETVQSRVSERVDRRRSHSVPMDLVCTYYERDREPLTSILGSAIALRLFLFMGVRRLPVRYPAIVRWFDLPTDDR